MPEQRGKRRKRPRKRVSTQSTVDSPATEIQAAPTSTRGARPARRGFQQLPPWGNIVFGLLIFGAGLYFFASQKGPMSTVRILLLILYAGLAGLYFGRAYRQYRRRS